MSGVDPTMDEGDASPRLDFSLTPSQFGISTQSFTPTSSSGHKDKSRLAQLKNRRKSSIGLRGSPEMNSLIRFRAKQRLSTPSTPQTPLDRGSPLLPSVSSTLKQKIASFQTLMNVEDCDGYNATQKEDKDRGGDERSPAGGKENCVPPVKRRCTTPLKECVEEIREASAVEEEKREIAKGRAPLVDTQGPKPLNESAKKYFFKPIRLNSEPHIFQARPLKSWTPHETQEPPFEVQSLSQQLPEAVLAPGLLPPTLEFKSTAKSDPSETDDTEANPKQRRRVHFGVPLSPELFDRNLPPSTPLKKGATPARSATPGDRLRPALKTPQRSEPRPVAAPSAQPDLGSPLLDLGASPVLTYSLTRCRKVPCPEDDVVETFETISFPSLDEMDDASAEKTEVVSEALDLNSAFQEEEPAVDTGASDPVPEPQAVPCAASQIEMPEEVKAHPQAEAQSVVELPAAPARSVGRKRKVNCLQGAPVQPAHSCGNQPEDSGGPVKRLMRSAAKAATGKMKASSSRRWSKEVDLSLYGSRLYASKDPTLSPIKETLNGSISSPCKASEESTLSLPTEALFLSTYPTTGVLTSATEQHDCSSTNNNNNSNKAETEDVSPTEKPPLDPVEIFTPRTGKLTRKTRSWSLPSSSNNAKPAVKSNNAKAKGRGGGRGRKVSVPVDPWLGGEPRSPPQTESIGHEHATVKSLSSVPENTEVCEDELSPQILVLEAQCMERGNEVELHTSLNEPVDIRVDVENEIAKSESMSELPHQNTVQTRVGSDHLDVQEGEVTADQTEESSTSVQGETGRPEPPSSDDPYLAPWQADFNVEDVFRPITSRGQRSVRRSLRNRSKAGSDCPSSGESAATSGMAWVPQTSPDSIRAVRRRSRQRLSAVSHPSDVSAASSTS